MEMRWAKKVSNSDCLISSDVYGYLYFDLVRYMKCTFSRWYILTVTVFGFMFFTWWNEYVKKCSNYSCCQWTRVQYGDGI